MLRWFLGAMVVMWGLAATAYLAWCQQRVSFTVLMSDPAWPRPWPYPDLWLARWYAQMDAANPGPLKMEGEWYRLQARVRAYNIMAFAVVAVGVAVLIWPTGRESLVWRSLRRGVAIGLVIGVSWTALICQLADESDPGWLSLAVYAIGFASAGAAVGAFRQFPELVGLCAASSSLSWLAGLARPDVDYCWRLQCSSHLTLGECARLVAGIDGELAWLVVCGGSGLLWGPVIGAIHRLFREPAKQQPRSPSLVK